MEYTLKEIAEQTLECTDGMTTLEYKQVFDLLGEEEKLKRLRFFIECIKFPCQDEYLKTSKEYEDFIEDIILSAKPRNKAMLDKDVALWQDLSVGRLNVNTYKFLTSNLWLIHSTQLLKCKNCSFESLMTSMDLRDLELKADGTPCDSYIEFVLKAFSDKDALAAYVKKYHTKFIDKAGYLYLYRLNEKLDRHKGNYVDYKDIRVRGYLYNKDSNLVMVKIGPKPEYKPLETERQVKRKKRDSYAEE